MSDIFEVIKESKSILLLTHENPDGDAIGSALAFYNVLRNLEKDVEIVIPEVPHLFMFLPNSDKIISQSNRKYDLAIVVDCSNEKRIYQTNDEFKNCKRSIVVDHHVSNTNYGTINFVKEEIASCAQVIYCMFKDWNIGITKEIGECLMTGSITDTNGFRNDNVDRDTFLMAAEMIDIGVDIHRIYFKTLFEKNPAQHALIKMTLDRLEFFGDGKVVFSYISKEDMENVGAKKGDHEGLVDLGRNIEGVEVSIFMREDEGYNVSFRSNGIIDVEKIASRLGGGGHKMAAGVKIKKDFKEVKDVLINETLKELANYGWDNLSK